MTPRQCSSVQFSSAKTKGTIGNFQQSHSRDVLDLVRRNR